MNNTDLITSLEMEKERTTWLKLQCN